MVKLAAREVRFSIASVCREIAFPCKRVGLWIVLHAFYVKMGNYLFDKPKGLTLYSSLMILRNRFSAGARSSAKSLWRVSNRYCNF